MIFLLRMYQRSLGLLICVLVHTLTSGLQSAFDVIHTPVMDCNASCVNMVQERSLFLDTAPCPPVWNLSLICQHSYRLDCAEVATILDRCISHYDVDCDYVFSALDVCVCDFNMTCSAMNETYLNNCGWRDREYSCQSTPTTLIVSPSGTNLPTRSGVGNETVGHTTPSGGDDKTPDDLESTTEDDTTPATGGSATPSRQSCDSTCIVMAVLGPTVFVITMIVLYRCYKRYNIRPGKTGPMAMTKVNSIDSTFKESRSIVHPGEKEMPIYPFMEKPLSHTTTASLKVGRPCSSFCTNMFDRMGPDTLPYYPSRTLSVDRAWEDHLQSAVTVSDSGTMTLCIPRPSLVTFKYKPDNQHKYDRLMDYTNPVYDESSY